MIFFETPIQQQQYEENKYGLMSESSKKIDRRERFNGTLKFFDEGKSYGFIVMDSDGSDLFVHFDDLKKTGIKK